MSLSVPCPHCNASLKLPGREYLGKKAKCPKCRQAFVLQEPEADEPDEVPLTLAEPPAPNPAAPPAGTPMVGTSAKWVPDNPNPAFQLADPQPPAAPPAPVAPQQPAFPQQPVAPQQPAPNWPPGAMPPNEGTQPTAVPPVQPVGQPPTYVPPAMPPGVPPQQTPPMDVAPPAAADDLSASNFRFDDLDASQPSTADAPAIGEPTAAGSPPKSSVASRVRRRKRGKGPIVVGVGTALMVICVIALWMQHQKQQAIEAANKQAEAAPQVNEDWRDAKAEMASSNVEAKSLSPTSGDPIPMDYMPIQPQLICHLRPAEIWAPDARSQEFVFLTFDFGSWLSEQLKAITRFEPQEIKEVTFGINFGSRTSEPQICGVVRLQTAPSLSELQRERFRGELQTDLKEDVYRAADFAYMLVAPDTFVFAPSALAADLPGAKSFPANPSVELEILQQQSDRTRPATVLLDVPNIDTHRQYVLGNSLHDISDKFVLWFGKEVRTVSWSYHLSGNEFYMETLVHPINVSTPLKVQRHLQLQLQRLPSRLMEAASFMQPSTAGYRKLIGRFPAMIKALELGTSTHVEKNLVRMVTVLPSKAGPNLVAGAMTTWNQSLLTDFTGPAAVVSKGPKLPDTVAERLQMKVIVDFRRMPLQEAFAYVSEEIKTPITINGDALKLAGMTQNMPQTYNLGEVSALKTIDTMIGNPDYKGALVIVVDEGSKSIQLTTRTVAEESGLTIYDTKQ